MARYCGFAEEAMDSVLITLDKMDKIGFEGVEKELLENGNAPESVSRYMIHLYARDWYTLWRL